MNQKTIQQSTLLASHILNVVGSLLIQILGIQIILLVLPVHTGDKRFNQ